MFFGLCNSPSTFQTIMNEIFTDMEDVLVVYINDVIVTSTMMVTTDTFMPTYPWGFFRSGMETQHV